MKKKIYSFLILLLLTFGFTSAQTGTLAGNIIDGEFIEPMAFANILVKGTTIGTTSDFDGKYQLELEPSTYTIVFSFVGYTTQEIMTFGTILSRQSFNSNIFQFLEDGSVFDPTPTDYQRCALKIYQFITTNYPYM
jgi:hypothetical protein